MTQEPTSPKPDPRERGAGPDKHHNLFLFAPAGTGLRAVAVSSMAARLPVGTTAVALPLFALADERSAVIAGASVGCFRVAQAAVSPVWGRVADRASFSRLFLLCGIAYSVVLCTIAVWGRGTTQLLLLSLLLGATMLPHTAVMRSFWRRQPELADRQAMVNTFESFMSEGILLIGRLLIALLFLVATPEVLLFVQAALAATGAAALASRPRVRHESRTRASNGPRSRGWVILARSAPVIACFLILSASLGAFSIGLTLRMHAVDHGNTWAAVAVAAWGSGSLIGVYLLRQRVGGRLRRWFIGLAAPMALSQLAVLTTTIPWLACVIALLAGVPIAAAVVCLYGLLDLRRIDSHHAEQLAWATTAIFAGDAIGGALAGAVAASVARPAWPIVSGAACALIACAAVALLRRSAAAQ